MTGSVQLHATAVSLDDAGILLRGPSGSGKSDLALRLIDGGALLVADDRVDLSLKDGIVLAQPPAALAGLLEVRGVGILRAPSVARAPLRLVVDLAPGSRPDRLPKDEPVLLLGVAVRRLVIDPFEASAPAKLRAAVRWKNVTDRPVG